jgi:hypothetical protein
MSAEEMLVCCFGIEGVTADQFRSVNWVVPSSRTPSCFRATAAIDVVEV